MKNGFFSMHSQRQPSLPEVSDICIDTVFLDVVRDCTLKCAYCFTGRGASFTAEGSIVNNAPRRMTELQVRQVIDFFVDSFLRDGKSSSLHFSFGLTGEPLLALDLFHSIQEHVDRRRAQCGKKITCGIPSTNATLLNDEIAEYLHRVHRSNPAFAELPAISIDGPEDIHNAMRRFPNGQGSYDTIEPLVKKHVSKWPATGAAALTGAKPYVTEIFLHLFNLGFRSIIIKPVRAKPSSSFAITSENIERVKEEYTRFVNFLLSQDSHNLLCYLSALHEADFFCRFLKRLLLHAKIYYRCPAAKSFVAVDTNGDIYPCDSFVGVKDFKLGNVFTGEIDQDKRKRFVLLRVDNKPVCASCWARYFCGGGCYHSAWLTTGRIETPDPVKCQFIRHLIQLGIFLLAEIQEREPRILKALI